MRSQTSSGNKLKFISKTILNVNINVLVSADKSLEMLPHFSDDEYMQENRVLLRNPETLNYKIKPIIKTEVITFNIRKCQ